MIFFNEFRIRFDLFKWKCASDIELNLFAKTFARSPKEPIVTTFDDIITEECDAFIVVRRSLK